jgi:hypothetical protein
MDMASSTCCMTPLHTTPTAGKPVRKLACTRTGAVCTSAACHHAALSYRLACTRLRAVMSAFLLLLAPLLAAAPAPHAAICAFVTPGAVLHVCNQKHVKDARCEGSIRRPEGLESFSTCPLRARTDMYPFTLRCQGLGGPDQYLVAFSHHS